MTQQLTFGYEAAEELYSVITKNFTLTPTADDPKESVAALKQCLLKYGIESNLQIIKGGTK